MSSATAVYCATTGGRHGSGSIACAGTGVSAADERYRRRHAHWIPSLPFLPFRHPMGVRTVPVLRTSPDRTRGARFLTDTSVCVPIGGADLVVVSRCTSGAGTPPKRRAACRAALLDESALDLAGVVVDDQPWHLMVCVPASPVPFAFMVARFHPRTHRARASDPLHRLCSHGRAVPHRPHHRVTGGGPEDKSCGTTILMYLAAPEHS